MIDFIPILKMDGQQEKRFGIVALDHMNQVAVFTDKNLSAALDAMFRDTKSLFRTSNSKAGLVRQEIMPNERAAWLSELRRQLPSPYYGGSIGFASHSLDQIPQLYQALEGEDKSTYEFERL